MRLQWGCQEPLRRVCFRYLWEFSQKVSWHSRKHQIEILPVNNIKKGGVLFSCPKNIFREGLGIASWKQLCSAWKLNCGISESLDEFWPESSWCDIYIFCHPVKELLTQDTYSNLHNPISVLMGLFFFLITSRRKLCIKAWSLNPWPLVTLSWVCQGKTSSMS